MTLNLGLVLLIVSALVWIYSLARRSRTPFTLEILDAIYLILVAIYFHQVIP